MQDPPVLPPLRTSSSWFTSTPPEPTTAAQRAQQRGASKFGTVSGPVSGDRRPRIGMAFFDSDPSGAGQAALDDELRDLQGLGRGADESWSVSVTETHNSRPKTRGKKDPVLLTLYVSTPTSSLTLSRSYHSIIELDARLRSELPGRLSARLPPTPTTPKKRANVLATLSRTLSPRRSPSSSPTSNVAARKGTNELAETGAYFTKLGSDSVVRAHSTWKAFFVVRADDLESARVERRVKRVRSDVGTVTNHLAMVPLSTHDVGGESLEDEMTTALSAGRKEPSGESSSASDSSDSVDTSVAQRVDLFDLASSVQTGKLGALDADLEGGGKRREASSATDVTDMSGSSEACIFELPSRPRTADQEPGSRTSRIIEMPQLDPKPSKVVTTSPSPPALSIDSFDCMRVLGKGCAGKVLLVRQRSTGALYALKAIHKVHVLAHRELDHTRTEQSVLKRCSRDQSNPFVVRLHYSFHDKETLYLALDFHPGGDLATQLARWGRLGRDRTRFYTAEIVEGVEGLHRAGVIYRDLKPENILISEAGHVVLTDFGLSKDFGHASIPPSSSEAEPKIGDGSLSPPGAPLSPRPHWLSPVPGSSRSVSTPPSAWMAGRRETTSTFCGTAEYLAPEVLLGEPYSYEVDSWSLGTMLYEMLAGVTPFWSEDHSTMYRRVLHEELSFDEDHRVFDDDTKSLLRGLLQRNPLLRMTDARIKRHPYFSMIEWPHVFYKRYVPPFIPSLNPLDPTDTSQFDDTYTSQMPRVSNEVGVEAPGDEREAPEGEPQAAFDEDGHDVFDGYSYFGGRDTDSIVGPDSDDDVEDIESSEAPDATTPLVSALPDVPDVDLEVAEVAEADVDPDLDADRSGTADATFSSTSMTSLLTPATSLQPSPEQPARRRQRSEGLDSLAEAPSSAENDMIVEDADDEPSEDDWDVIDAEVLGESKNGGKESTLWAKGVKDKYRLLLSSTPRGGSPLRPTPARSAGGSRKESSGSANSSVTPSPSLLPEPRRSLRRLGSARSSNSSKAALKTRASQRSLRVESELTKRRLAESAPGSSGLDGTPKRGQTMKRLASAFRIP